MLQLDEKALLAAGMSLLWVPKNPRVTPVGRSPWVEQIKDNFIHPTPESLNAYIATPTGAPPYVSTRSKVGKSPAREVTILLSSEESTGSSHGFIDRSTRAGPRVWPSHGAEGDVALNPATVEPEVVATTPMQWKPEMKAQLEEQTSKHSSQLQYLDYVVVSDTLSGLDVGVKRTAADFEKDQATHTRIMEKNRKLLSDTKQLLDTVEAAIDVFEKKRTTMGQAMAHSESEVDLGVFAKKSGSILEELYMESSKRKGGNPFSTATGSKSKRLTSQGSKPATPDIFSIPGLESPPAVVYGDSPVHGPLPLKMLKGRIRRV
ncbi:hypothetical protein Hanom_Chr16g01467681 [Helianthus anomalus]